MIELPGLRRYGILELTAGVTPGEPWWCDQVLWDISTTVEAAVRNIAALGGKAVTLYWGITVLQKWSRVINTCKELGLIIVICDDDFRREVWWKP